MFCARSDVQRWKRELSSWKAWYLVCQYLGRQWTVAGRVGDGMCGGHPGGSSGLQLGWPRLGERVFPAAVEPWGLQ